jgi:hypothetical protein
MCAPWRNACRADAASSYTPSWPCLYALGHPVCCSFLNCFRSRAACCFTSAAHDQPLGVSQSPRRSAGWLVLPTLNKPGEQACSHGPAFSLALATFSFSKLPFGRTAVVSRIYLPWPTQSGPGLRRQQHTGGAPIETSRSDISHMRVELNASWICLPIRLADRAIPHTPLTASSRSAGHSGVQSISAQR